MTKKLYQNFTSSGTLDQTDAIIHSIIFINTSGGDSQFGAFIGSDGSGTRLIACTVSNQNSEVVQLNGIEVEELYIAIVPNSSAIVIYE